MPGRRTLRDQSKATVVTGRRLRRATLRHVDHQTTPCPTSSTAKPCDAGVARRGEELIAPGLLMLAGPVDLDELDRNFTRLWCIRSPMTPCRDDQRRWLPAQMVMNDTARSIQMWRSPADRS